MLEAVQSSMKLREAAFRTLQHGQLAATARQSEAQPEAPRGSLQPGAWEWGRLSGP
jgi:hypothetical protein